MAGAKAVSRLFEVSFVALLLACFSYFVQPPGYNEASRYDLVVALLQDRSTAIDPYEFNTIDKVLVDGHYYTEKAIGLSLLALPASLIFREALGLAPYGTYRAEYETSLATRWAVSLPAALAAWLLYLAMRRFGARAVEAAFAAAAVALATAWLPFSTMLFGHLTAGALAFGAAALLFFSPGRTGVWLLAGFLGGLATLTEYPAFLAAGLLGLYGMWRYRDRVRSFALPYAAGATVALTPLPIYNWVSFGAPWTLGYAKIDDPQFAGMQHGLLGVTLPSLAALGEIALGPAGLLTQSTWLLLVVPGFALWIGRGKYRAEGLTALTVVVAFLAYNASYYLPMGGQAQGPRFLLPMLPFAGLALAFVPRRLLWAALPFVAFSALQMLAIAAVYPKPGLGNTDTFFTYLLPRVGEGGVVENWGTLRFGLEGAGSLLPLVALAACALLGIPVAVFAARRARTVSLKIALAYAAVAIGLAVYVSSPVDFQVPLRPPSFYAQLAPPQTWEHAAGISYGRAVELLGYSFRSGALGSDAVEPGGKIDVELFWRSLGVIDKRYVVYTHFFGPNGEKLGAFDAMPGNGTYPIHSWPVGTIVRDAYRVPLAAGPVSPSAIQVRVGVYEAGLKGYLEAVDSSGNSIGHEPVIARLRMGPAIPPPTVGSVALATFEDRLALVEQRLPKWQYRPGETITGKLRWQALARVPQDYTVFVQLVGRSGLLGQWDCQPGCGRYPTSLWREGEQFEDEFTIKVQPAAPPGRWQLITGWYDAKTLRRLAAGSGDFVSLGFVEIAE